MLYADRSRVYICDYRNKLFHNAMELSRICLLIFRIQELIILDGIYIRQH